MKILHIALHIVLVAGVSQIAQAQQESAPAKPWSGTVHKQIHPGLMSDAVIQFTPDRDFDLLSVSRVERSISGKIDQIERSADSPIGIITHHPNTFIQPLLKGITVRLYLKKYKDRDDVYIIAIEPIASLEGKP